MTDEIWQFMKDLNNKWVKYYQITNCMFIIMSLCIYIKTS